MKKKKVKWPIYIVDLNLKQAPFRCEKCKNPITITVNYNVEKGLHVVLRGVEEET